VLPEPAAPKRSTTKYVAFGFVVVALAAMAGILATSAIHANVAVNADFEDAYAAEFGNVPNCDKNVAGYLSTLPKYDPTYSTDPSEFYNSCYFAYRCCSTTGNSDGCYVSDSFGAKCRGCLSENGPRMVRGTCVDWLHYYGPGAAEEEQGVDWTENDMLSDQGFPDTNVPDYHLKFITFKDPTCWVQAGGSDSRMDGFVTKCFEVISWCNLLCPRDTPKSNDHKMCKQCTLFGFANKDTGLGF
jgi:hypothetical protein